MTRCNVKIERFECTAREAIEIVGALVVACFGIGFFAAHKGMKPEMIEKPPVVVPDSKNVPNDAKGKEVQKMPPPPPGVPIPAQGLPFLPEPGAPGPVIPPTEGPGRGTPPVIPEPKK